MSTVSVLIVNFNGENIIGPCLESLFKSEFDGELDIIVIDNQSKDSSIDILKRYSDKIKLIKNNHNSGFAMGNNIAAQFAKGDYVFLLNNDTIINPDTIQGLVDYIKSDESIGAVMPRLLNEDLSIQCPGSIFAKHAFKSDTTRELSFMPGAAVLMSKALYDDMNGIDPNYLFYNDDIDFSRVIRKRGLKLMLYPHVSLVHLGGVSTTFRKLPSLCEGYRGGIYFAYKHFGFFLSLVYRVLLLVDIVPRSLIHLCCSPFSKTHRSYFLLYLKVLGIMLTNTIFIHHPDEDIEELS